MSKENAGDEQSKVVSLAEFKKEKARKKEAELRDRIIVRAVEKARERDW